jgi:hypothetical protein
LLDLLGLSEKPKSKKKGGAKDQSASKPEAGTTGGDSAGTAKTAPDTPPDNNQRPGVGDVAGDGSDPLVDYLLGGAQ